MLSRGATLAARWLHEPQPISNQLVGWDLYTARGGIDPGDLCFRPRIVGVVEIWRDFSSEHTTLSSPGAAGLRRWPEEQLSPRAGSMSFIQSATSQWG